MSETARGKRSGGDGSYHRRLPARLNADVKAACTAMSSTGLRTKLGTTYYLTAFGAGFVTSTFFSSAPSLLLLFSEDFSVSWTGEVVSATLVGVFMSFSFRGDRRQVFAASKDMETACQGLKCWPQIKVFRCKSDLL